MHGWKALIVYTITPCLAAGITYLLFILIPVLHSLFGFDLGQRPNLKQRPVVVMEHIAAQRKQEKPKEQRIRAVNAPSGKGARGGSNQMAMRFTPDLSIDAGPSGSGVAVQQQELAPEIYEEGETDQDVIPMQTTLPYPERARELGIEGTLEMLLVIGVNGRVESVEVVKSPHPSISEAARSAVKQWRFKPAQKNGVPVRQRVRLPIELKLDE